MSYPADLIGQALFLAGAERTMWVASCFEGDDLEWVMKLQHDAYGDMVRAVFSTAKNAYLHAEMIIGACTNLGKLAKEEKTFDYRTLQHLHDVIASEFRRVHRDKLAELSRLTFPNDANHLNYADTLWRNYLQEEVDRLIRVRPDVVRDILTAALYPNPDPQGMFAESRLTELLKAEYRRIRAVIL